MPYTGIIAEIPAGRAGLNADQNVASIPVINLIEAEGIVMESGTWRKEPGASLYGSAITGTPTIVSVCDWWPDLATQRTVCAALDGKLYKDDGSGDLDATTLKTGLSTTARGMFVEAGKEAAANNRKLFYVNGANIVQVLSGNGATTTDVSKPPTDWASANQPSFGVLHQGRLWGMGNANDPHRIYGSTTSDHEDFTTSPLSMSVFPGVGLRLVGAISFQGTLFLWKFPRGIAWLDDSEVDTANWRIRLKSSALGAANSPGAILPIDDDVLFLTAEGRFHLLTAVGDNLSDVRSSDLSATLKIDGWLRDNIALDRLNQVTSRWFGLKKLAVFGLPRVGSTGNDLRLMFDFSDVAIGGPVKVSYSYRDRVEALGLRRDTDGIERPVFGDNAGQVYLLDRATRSKDGGGYPAQYQTPYTDFSYIDASLGGVRKNFDALDLVLNPTGAWDLSVDVLIDGAHTQTVNFSVGGASAALGSFILDTHQLSGSYVIQSRKRISGNGFRLSLRGRNSGAGQDFSVIKHLVSFRPAGQEQRED